MAGQFSYPLQLFDVSGRSVLITGATGAFGGMASEALAAAGCRLTLAAGTVEHLEELGEELRGQGAAVELVPRRPERLDDATEMVAAAVRAHGRLDIVVTASGMNKPTPIVDQTVEDWQAIMDANVRGSWLVCKAAGRQMLEQGKGGKVILVSSVRGLLGIDTGVSAYSPSKAAVNLLAKTLACEWGAHGINVNAIAPSLFRSALTAWVYADTEEARKPREAYLARIPVGRLAEPSDFVGAVLYFASDASNYCTGQVLCVDGGYTAG